MRKLLMTAFLAASLPAMLMAGDQKAGTTNDWGGGWGGGGGWGACGGSSGSYTSTLSVVGLTRDQRLICFNEYSPGSASTIGTVSGLTGGDTMLLGIDFRVQDGNLYGLGNSGGVYILDAKTAAATFVNRLTVALTGTSFGVDFNPVADRLRVVSNTGQNLRHNVNAGGTTTVDGMLNYTAGTTATGIVGAAYTNNDLDPTTATTLYNVDSNLDQITIQSPPNNGSLAATGKLTVDTGSDVGFDIYSTIRNGVTVRVQALASLTSSTGAASLYTITLATGKAELRGSFSTQNQVMDIAIPLNQL